MDGPIQIVVVVREQLSQFEFRVHALLKAIFLLSIVYWGLNYTRISFAFFLDFHAI